MNPFLAIFAARFRLLLHYRSAAVAGVITQIAWGIFISEALSAYYRGASTAEPMPLDQLISYLWLGQALFAMLPWTPDPELRLAVRSGQVSYDLLRPVDLYVLWLARALALRLAPTLLRATPLLILAYSFFGLQGPASARAAAAFALTLPGALVLSASFTVLINTTLFWTISGEGVVHAMPAIVPFFAGMILPLPLFPTWAQPLLAVLPFRGIVDAPYRLYNGHLPARELWAVLIHQWSWVTCFIVAGRALLQRGVARISVP